MVSTHSHCAEYNLSGSISEARKIWLCLKKRSPVHFSFLFYFPFIFSVADASVAGSQISILLTTASASDNPGESRALSIASLKRIAVIRRQ